jgi:RIO kinase 2
VKLHRLGLVSFKHARKKRRHLSERVDIFLARENALREWEALNLLYPEVSVPKPIDHTRHAILMGFLSGKQLSRVKVKEPKWWLNQIMKEAKKAWKLGIVHADLSEYNVLASEEGITLIDWCQWISSEDEGAKEIFREDMERVKAHFRRKYKVG